MKTYSPKGAGHCIYIRPKNPHKENNCTALPTNWSTMPDLDITLMQVLPGKIVFTIGEKLKTTRLGKHLEPIELLEYPQDGSLCVVSHLKQYIKNVRNSFELRKTQGCSSVTLSRTNQSSIPPWVNGLKVSFVKQVLTPARSPVTVPDPHQLRMAPRAFLSDRYVTLT